MTVLEGLLLLILAALVLLLPFRRPENRLRSICLLLVLAYGVLLILYPLFDGLRWNGWGYYLLAPLLVWGCFKTPGAAATKARRIAQRLFHTALILGALTCGFFLYVAPVPEWPAPTGPFAVGTTSHHWIDSNRQEVYGDASGPREIMVQVWYPAPRDGVGDQEPEAWFMDGERISQVVGDRYGVGAFLLQPVQLARSHSYADIPFATDQGPFPVIIYSHGWGSSRRLALDSIEHLVSHGYCVVAADHTYGALATSFPDGRLVPRDPKAMPPDEPRDARQVGIERLVQTFASDVQFILEKLAELEPQDGGAPFAGQLDLDRVGLFGHSTGGGAVYRAALEAAPVRAVAGLDPWVEPIPLDMRPQGLHLPTLSIRSERWYTGTPDNNAVLREMLAAAQGPVHDLVIAGTTHYDFSLIGYISPLMNWIGVTGPTAVSQTLEIVNKSLLHFFDEHVREKSDTRLTQVVETYPELFEADKGPSEALAADVGP